MPVEQNRPRRPPECGAFGPCRRIVSKPNTDYSYVHPNNHRMIEFLRKRGYTVLNLIEICKPYKDEKLMQTIVVGEHEFDY